MNFLKDLVPKSGASRCIRFAAKLSSGALPLTWHSAFNKNLNQRYCGNLLLDTYILENKGSWVWLQGFFIIN